MPDSTWPAVLSALAAGTDLDATQAEWAMGQILAGEATPGQIGGFLVGMRAKGETVEEITALVETMYRYAEPLGITGRVVDVVGTGGDGAHTVNISTMAAVVVAGTGIPVVKHGNRAATGQCGSADVLEALGVRLDKPIAELPDVFDATQITFCFAPAFHPSMRFAGPIRKELGIPTTFNFLGPLANPARPQAMAVGVSDARMAPLMAGVLAQRGVEALVFRGDDGLDELSISTTSSIWVVSRGQVTAETFDPAPLGIAPVAPDALAGGDAAFNADVFRRVIEGEEGPVRDAVLLNAAAGIAAYEEMALPMPVRMAIGLERATESIDGGGAAKVLDKWIEATA